MFTDVKARKISAEGENDESECENESTRLISMGVINSFLKPFAVTNTNENWTTR
jgi:hypothetical protein